MDVFNSADISAVLLAGGLPAGLVQPSPELEEKILDAVRKHGAVAPELPLMEEFL